MENRKAWEALKKLETVLEKNNLIDSELRSYIWDLEDYINICELSIYEKYDTTPIKNHAVRIGGEL